MNEKKAEELLMLVPDDKRDYATKLLVSILKEYAQDVVKQTTSAMVNKMEEIIDESK